MNTSQLFARRTVRGYEFRQGIESFAHQLTEHLSLGRVTVSWDSIPTARIDGNGNITLAAVRDDAVIDRATVTRYAGFVVHELLHKKWSAFNVNGNSTYLRALHNAVEDAWIERRAIASGLTGNIKGLLTELIGQVVAESMTRVDDWADPSVYPFVLAVHCRQYGITIPVAEGLLPIFDEAARRIDACQSSTQTLHIAEWVYDQLHNLPEQQPEQQPEQGKGEQGDGQGDGEQAQSEQGESEGEGEGQAQSEGEGEGDGSKAGSATRPGDSTVAMEVEPTAGAPEGGLGASWCAAYEVTKNAEFHLNVKAAHRTAAPVPARLRHEVRRIFDNSGMTAFTRGRKSGTVNVGALHQVGTTGRIFQQRRDVEGIDSAVAVVLDCSTSMRHLIGEVAAVGSLLIETLQSAQVATAAVAFCDRVSVPVPFGTRVQKAREILSRLTVTGGTNDFAAIRHATDLLMARSEARRVIFVVTDGDGNPAAARQQIAAARALGIEVIGVGICHNVEHLYGKDKSLRVNRIDDLGGAVFSKIKVAA